MAKPPETPPHSDEKGVDMDGARAGKADRTHPDPGGEIDRAKEQSTGRPREGATPDSTATEGH